MSETVNPTADPQIFLTEEDKQDLDFATHKLERQLDDYLGKKKTEKGDRVVFDLLVDTGLLLRNAFKMRKQLEIAYRVLASMATEVRSLQEEGGPLSTLSNAKMADSASKFVDAALEFEGQLCRFTIERDAQRTEIDRVPLVKAYSST